MVGGSIVIRVLGPADADGYFALRLKGLLDTPFAFGSSYEDEKGMSEAEVLRRVTPDEGKRVFGAFVGSELVGMVGIMQERETIKRHKKNIYGMYVDGTFRGRGLGRDLMQAAIEFGFSLPVVRQISLGVAEKNVPARRLYESLGFIPYGFERACTVVDDEDIDELMLVLYRRA